MAKREPKREPKREEPDRQRPQPEPAPTPKAGVKFGFSEPRPFEIRGEAVALVTCLECGAALLVDVREPDAKALHREWHA